MKPQINNMNSIYKKGFTLKHFVNEGFTLIELLVVIGVLAVVASGVVALINPQDKIRQANDAKIINDIGQLATAAQSYAAQQNSGTYPDVLADLTASGELTTLPTQSSGANYPFTAAPAGCAGTAASPCTSVTIGLALTSLKYTSDPAADTWVWCSSTGRAGAVANLTTCP